MLPAIFRFSGKEAEVKVKVGSTYWKCSNLILGLISVNSIIITWYLTYPLLLFFEMHLFSSGYCFMLFLDQVTHSENEKKKRENITGIHHLLISKLGCGRLDSPGIDSHRY